MVQLVIFFFQAEDGIRDLVRSRGLGDVYKRQSSSPRRSESMSATSSPTSGRSRQGRRGSGSPRGLSLIHI